MTSASPGVQSLATLTSWFILMLLDSTLSSTTTFTPLKILSARLLPPSSPSLPQAWNNCVQTGWCNSKDKEEKNVILAASECACYCLPPIQFIILASPIKKNTLLYSYYKHIMTKMTWLPVLVSLSVLKPFRCSNQARLDQKTTSSSQNKTWPQRKKKKKDVPVWLLS